MLVKIISAGAMMLLLTGGGALASGSTISTLQRATSGHNDNVSHRNATQRYATLPAPNGYKDTQGSHALGGGPG
jgi:hypothetical protein